jgi:hypothetical protein
MEDGCVGGENGTDATKSRSDGLDSHVIRHDVDTDTDIDLYSMASTMALT